MSAHRMHPRFSLDTPAVYDITVAGYLDKSWSARVGMVMDHATIENGMAVTVLRGKLVDQAALFGLLNGLYGLGFPLLSVECKSLA